MVSTPALLRGWNVKIKKPVNQMVDRLSVLGLCEKGRNYFPI